MIDLLIPGEPVGKGRPRVATIAGRARAYTPKGTAEWEAGAAMLLRAAWTGAPLDEPVELVVEAVAARPKALIPGPRKLSADPALARRLWRVTKPDGDNVLKCVGDALVMAGVIRDDTRIVRWECLSLVAALDEGPSVRVVLRRAGACPC